LLNAKRIHDKLYGEYSQDHTHNSRQDRCSVNANHANYSTGKEKQYQRDEEDADRYKRGAEMARGKTARYRARVPFVTVEILSQRSFANQRETE
jgi:hypothetical protein